MKKTATPKSQIEVTNDFESDVRHLKVWATLLFHRYGTSRVPGWEGKEHERKAAWRWKGFDAWATWMNSALPAIRKSGAPI